MNDERQYRFSKYSRLPISVAESVRGKLEEKIQRYQDALDKGEIGDVEAAKDFIRVWKKEIDRLDQQLEEGRFVPDVLCDMENKIPYFDRAAYTDDYVREKNQEIESLQAMIKQANKKQAEVINREIAKRNSQIKVAKRKLFEHSLEVKSKLYACKKNNNKEE